MLSLGHADGAVGPAADGRPARREPRARDGCTTRSRTASRSRRRSRRSPTAASRSSLEATPRTREQIRRRRPRGAWPTRSTACSRRASSRRRRTSTRACCSAPAGRSSSAGSRSTSTRSGISERVFGRAARRLRPAGYAPGIAAWPRTTGGSGSSFPTREVPQDLLERLGLRHERRGGARRRAARAPARGLARRRHRVRLRGDRHAGRAGRARRRERAERPRIGAVDRFVTEHWLHDEERWDDEPARRPDVEEELLERGYAPWEVRVEADSLARGRTTSPSSSAARATTSPGPSRT